MRVGGAIWCINHRIRYQGTFLFLKELWNRIEICPKISHARGIHIERPHTDKKIHNFLKMCMEAVLFTAQFRVTVSIKHALLGLQ